MQTQVTQAETSATVPAAPPAPNADTTTQADNTILTDATASDNSGEVKADATKEEAKKPNIEIKEDDQLLFDEKKQEEGKTDDAEKKEEDKTEEENKEETAIITVENLALPDDVIISEDIKGSLNELISEHKLSKETAQKMVDIGVKMEQKRIDDWYNMKNTWKEESIADPEIGGKNLDKTKSNCNRLINQFAGSEENLAECKQDLILLGLGNKRSFLRLLNNIANATGNDDTQKNSNSGGSNNNHDNSYEAKAKRMYPNMN